MKKVPTNELKVVSLFTGGGGLDLGLEAAGFKTIFATDIDEHSCLTLNQNKQKSKEKGRDLFENAFIHRADINDLTSEFIFQSANIKKGELDLLAGGPPCQAFSVFGKRQGKKDPRGMLAYEYLRLLKNIAPKCFVFENVYGLLTIDNGDVFSELCEQLSNPGNNLNYELSIFRLNAADYAVPQFRDRVFIIGSLKGGVITEIPKICSPENSDKNPTTLLPYRTVDDGLRDLPPMGEVLANHIGRKHSDRIKERYSLLSFGERDSKTRINKLNPTRPSYTIIVGSDKGGGKGHVHPYEPREVTPRESARMQTFPDWWEFSGTSRHPIRQVGNAVPPLLSALIGREIKSVLFNRRKTTLEEIVNFLSLEHLFKEDISEL
ncbi:DNA cytosine methyltransferase [Pseudoalteromonas rhizosphaerae]|jgi:DNA (cytosine-5)-methyltransferase 1|uniref:DNA cytosine methyltransferase n=1 Tax=Pseudoalteromonas rhizosphaerae TaxID=2518973 RepID=UPI0037041F53